MPQVHFAMKNGKAVFEQQLYTQQLELFPLNLRDTVSREDERRLIKERDDAILAAHYEYECRTETQLVNPVACDWWWANEYTDTVIENYPKYVAHIYDSILL